jgi:hypothetical protein
MLLYYSHGLSINDPLKKKKTRRKEKHLVIEIHRVFSLTILACLITFMLRNKRKISVRRMFEIK